MYYDRCTYKLSLSLVKTVVMLTNLLSTHCVWSTYWSQGYFKQYLSQFIMSIHHISKQNYITNRILSLVVLFKNAAIKTWYFFKNCYKYGLKFPSWSLWPIRHTYQYLIIITGSLTNTVLPHKYLWRVVMKQLDHTNVQDIVTVMFKLHV